MICGAAGRYGLTDERCRSEDVNIHGLQQATPSLKRTYSAFEDPFSDVVSAFDHPMQNDQNDPETPSIDRDNKLLSFSMPRFDYHLLTYNFQRTSMQLSAQLHGMFFLAESPWAAADNAQPPPNELTCYRRNLFQITGDITVPRSLHCILTDQGEQIPILSQELVINATESTEGNPVKIISVPWKTPANPNQPTAEDKVEREPPAIPIDLMNLQDLDSEFASFPFQWKRLQFRIATANNGRRKELQQHFVIRIKVVATLATGGKIPICEVQSGAVIVRGRSPRNFQSRKDLPLNGSGHVRKTSHLPAPARSTSGESASNKKQHQEPPTSAPVKTEAQLPPIPTPSFLHKEAQPNLDYYSFNSPLPPQQNAMTAVPPQSSPFEDGNAYAVSSPDLARAYKSQAQSTAPINLSLVEDDSPKPKSSETPPSQHSRKIQIPPRPPSFSINTINSPDESADLLYEYFPLGLDDWMPPVDAVYRPHVVHHTKLPTDPRDPAVSAKSSRSKRLYSADVT